MKKSVLILCVIINTAACIYAFAPMLLAAF